MRSHAPLRPLAAVFMLAWLISTTAAQPKIELELRVDDRNAEYGQIQAGKVFVTVSGVTKPTDVFVYATQKDAGRKQAEDQAATTLRFDADGKQDVDLATQLPVTIVPGQQNPELVVSAFSAGMTQPISTSARLNPKFSSAKAEVTRVIAAVKPARPVAGEAVLFNLGYEVRNGGSQPVGVSMTDSLSLSSVDVSGYRPDPVQPRKWSAQIPAFGKSGAAGPAGWEITFPSPGRYVISYEIAGPGATTVKGAKHVWVAANPRQTGGGSGGTVGDPDGTVKGKLSLEKTDLKPGESTKLWIEYTMTGRADADVEEKFQITDDKGNPRGSSSVSVQTSDGKAVKHGYEIRCSASEDATFTIRTSVKGDRTNEWTDQIQFTVKKPAAPPPPSQPGGQPPAATGTFGLVKKVEGKAPADGVGPYGTLSGAISEGNVSITWEGKAPYDAHGKFVGTYSAAPAVLKPGEIIELTASVNATARGKDMGSMGIGVGWEASGSCERIEGKNVFGGLASDGKVYPGGQARFKFKIGTGGTITLRQVHGGLAWGDGAIWPPCTYTYQYNAPPSVDPGPGTDSGAGDSITAVNPDAPPQETQIEAWWDQDQIVLVPGEPSRIVDIHINKYRRNTDDRVEVIFPQKTDNWASLPGQIVVNGGDGHYWPANMGTPEHVDGYFFSARSTAPPGETMIDVIVRQKKAGFVKLKLKVKVVGKNKAAAPASPAAGATFDGAWDSDYTGLKLTQTGDRVSGSYWNGEGTLEGTVKDNVLTFTWKQGGTHPQQGSGRFTLAADGQSFTGFWTFGATPDEGTQRQWDGKRAAK